MAGVVDHFKTDLDFMFNEQAVSVTYRQKETAGSSFTASTGVIVRAFEDIALSAIRVRLNVREAEASGGIAQVGDCRFSFQADELLAGFVEGQTEPKAEDRIVDGAETFHVIGHILSSDENVAKVYCRRE